MNFIKLFILRVVIGIERNAKGKKYAMKFCKNFIIIMILNYGKPNKEKFCAYVRSLMVQKLCINIMNLSYK